MKNKNIAAVIAIILGLLIIVAGAYYGYTKLTESSAASSSASSGTSAAAETKSGVSEVPESSAFSSPASPDSVSAPAQYSAKDFTVYDLGGNAAKLSDNAGKITVLNFWATWCGPCLGELPDYQTIYEEYGDKVNFMFVEVSGSPTDIKSFAAKKGYTMPFYTDVSGDAQTAYNIRSIPQTYIFSPAGELLASHTGQLDYSGIKSLLDKATASVS